jgi:Protein of unknown function (DUF2800)
MNVALAHSQFGGSSAPRVINCPASVGLVAKVPAHLRRSSAYAERGTALHTVMALLLGDDAPALESLVGKTIDNYTLTIDDVENALRPAYAYVEALLDQPGAEYYLEQRVTFPTIAGAFGTCDLIVRISNIIHLVDYKFGSGVRVLALTPDGDADTINGQLLFYACAARGSLPAFFAGVDDIVLTILQPQSVDVEAEMVSSVEVSHAELDQFIEVYARACAEALAPAPRLARGDWCRFCAARPICPAHTGPLLDLAQLMAPTPAAAPSKEAYLRLLAEGLNLVDAVREISKALHDQAKQALHAGDLVPGYALTAGRAVRQWRDETRVAPRLLALGLNRADVLEEVLRSPKQIEIRAKARGVKVPKELIVSHPSGTSLARSENVRAPILGRDELVRSFSEALQAFQERKQS